MKHDGHAGGSEKRAQFSERDDAHCRALWLVKYILPVKLPPAHFSDFAPEATHALAEHKIYNTELPRTRYDTITMRYNQWYVTSHHTTGV